MSGTPKNGTSYKRNGRVLAVASIYRDVENLQAELMMQREMAGATSDA